jgi:hypothetical protein
MVKLKKSHVKSPAKSKRATRLVQRLRQKRLLVVLFAIIFVAAGAIIVLGSHAQGTGYYCDGNGSSNGSCMSLIPGGSWRAGSVIYAYGRNSGAWQWNQVWVGWVNSTWPFSDRTLDNEFSGKPVYQYVLYAHQGMCASEAGGWMILDNCNGSNEELFVQDSTNGSPSWSVSVARSDRMNHRYVMCSNGGGQQIGFVEPINCSAYHSSWALE